MAKRPPPSPFLRTREELEAMPQRDLVAHAETLQEEYKRLVKSFREVKLRVGFAHDALKDLP